MALHVSAFSGWLSHPLVLVLFRGAVRSLHLRLISAVVLVEACWLASVVHANQRFGVGHSEVILFLETAAA